MNRNTTQLDEATVTALTRANNRMVLPLAVGVLGSIFLAVAFMMQNEFNAKLETVTAWYLLASFFILVGATVFNVMFWNYIELKNQTKAPPPPDMPTQPPVFETVTRPRIMYRTSHNQWLVSKYRNINERQWRALYDALKNYDGLWSRDRSLKMSGIFTADETGIILTAAGEYAQLRDDFRRMSIIEKRTGSWYVTPEGWLRLAEMAGL